MARFRPLLTAVSLLALVGVAAPTLAQSQRYGFEFVQNIPVVVGTDTLAQPWTGGFNSVSFSKIELNGDGVEDLYVHDHTAQRHLTFVAENGAGGWQWRYAPSYEVLFPNAPALAVLLRDYDGDGRKDYFAVTAPQYIDVYRNTAVPTPAGFEFAVVPTRLQQDDGFGGTRPVATSIYSLLSIEDIDNDGDLDILDYTYGLNTLSLFRNTAGPGALPFFTEEQQWGGFVRCAGGGQPCHAYAFAGTFCRPLHGANRDYSLLAVDLDGDGDRDLLTGEQYCRDLALLQNQGTAQRPTFDRVGLTTPYPAGPPAASMVHTPGAFYEDVTFDGQRDLLVTPWLIGQESSTFPFVGDQYDATASAWLYARSGSSFGFQQDNFLQGQMIDLGAQAAPTLGDLDGDGDLDLLVGNLADFTSAPAPVVGYTAFRSQLRFFRNVGTRQRAIFKLEDNDFGQFGVRYKRSIVPVLTDLDGNGTPDLVLRYNADSVGSINGTRPLGYILNTAPAGQLAAFAWSNLRPFRFSQTNSSFRDLPLFYDVDGDGDRDIVMGVLQSGTVLQYFQNRGGAPDTAFVLANANFGQLPASLPGLSPAVADFDGDGQPELLTADDTGELRVWPQVLSTPNTATAFVDSLVRNVATYGFNAARLGTRPVLTTGDLDADGLPEVIVGTAGGGLRLLRHQAQANGLAEALAAKLGLEVFPNPANQELIVRTALGKPVAVEVLDALGRVVLTSGLAPEQHLNIAHLPAGLYAVRVRTLEGWRLVRRVVVAH